MQARLHFFSFNIYVVRRSQGEWSSPAFMKYLNITELEAGACLEAHLEESDVEVVNDPGSRRRRIVLV